VLLILSGPVSEVLRQGLEGGGKGGERVSSCLEGWEDEEKGEERRKKEN